MREMICCRCGKSMVEPDTGRAFIGLAANVRSNMDGFADEFLKEQLGAFQLDKEYYLCYECWLLNLGVVP